MRISTAKIYDNLARQINENAMRLQDLQEAASSGQRNLTLSSAPLEYVDAIALDGNIGRMEDLIRKGESYQGNLSNYDSVFSSLTEQLADAKRIAMQALNSSTGSDQKAILASQVNLILSRGIDLANSTYNGDYIFSGSAVDRQAFTVEKDGDTITAVNYQGDNKQLVRHLGAEEKIEISMSGERVFNGPAGSSRDLFAALIELREALSSDDTERLNSSMEKIDGCRDRIIGFRMEAGTRGQHLENSIRSMKSLKVTLEGDLGDLRGADITEVLMNLALQEVAYRASIQMASRLGSLDILEIFG